MRKVAERDKHWISERSQNGVNAGFRRNVAGNVSKSKNRILTPLGSCSCPKRKKQAALARWAEARPYTLPSGVNIIFSRRNLAIFLSQRGNLSVNCVNSCSFHVGSKDVVVIIHIFIIFICCPYMPIHPVYNYFTANNFLVLVYKGKEPH